LRSKDPERAKRAVAQTLWPARDEWLSPTSPAFLFFTGTILGFRTAPPRLYAIAALRGLYGKSFTNLSNGFQSPFIP
jgi:hypothetical protein